MRDRLKRTFTAIDINPGPLISEQLARIRGRLSGSVIKWTNPENMHLTLNFLGDTPERDIPALTGEMQQLLSSVMPFTLRLHSIGVFRNLRQPRIIWAGCDPLSTLSHVHDLMTAAVKKRGLRDENRIFTPHLTLGRIREFRDTDQLASLLTEYEGFTFLEQTVDHLIFYESLLKAEGPVYKVLQRLELGRT